MEIRDADVIHLARLARLELDAAEREGLRADLQRVLAHLGELASVDVDGLEPMLRPVHVDDGTRADEVRGGLAQETVLQAGRARQDGFLRVPRTGGDDG